MKRYLLSTLVLLAVCTTFCRAGEPGVSFGLEWGYSLSFFNLRQFNYLDADGSRVNVDERLFKAGSNAGILASFGLNVGERCNFSISSGYMGVEDNVRLVPLIAGFTCVPAGIAESGFVFNLRAGAGMNVLDHSSILPLADIGLGYRIAFENNYGIDLKFIFRGVYDHPSIFDPTYESGYVPVENIRDDRAIYLSVGFSAAFNF